jgi:SpoIID/LytB domain protein
LGERSIRLAIALLVATVACCSAAAAQASPPLFLISGGGFGHGVGLSQYGAEGFALRGYTYRHILAHYYPGTRLSRVGNPAVRVLLISNRSRVVIGSSARFRVTGANDRTVTLPTGDQGVTNSFSVLLGHRRRPMHFPLRFTPGAAPLIVNGTPYRGSLTVSRGLSVVNAVPIESYLRGVVPAEMPSHWLGQALAAQAVAARSYALASLQPAARFDLYPDMRSQVYLGIAAERASTDTAVAETAGRVLTWHGQVAKTFFSASSGGRTAANEDAWPGMRPVPYLRSVSDPYDTVSPYHRWPLRVLTAARLGARLGLGAIDDVQVTAARSGWARAVSVRTAAGVRTLTATEFAGRIGLRSQAFRIGVLQLQASATRTVYGRGIGLRVLARGLPAQLQLRRPRGTWHDAPLSSAVRPLRSTEYRLAAEGVTTAPMRVDVEPALVVRRDRRELSGRVAPAIGGLRLTVQRLLAGNWLTIRSARVSGGGTFRLDRALPIGTYRVKTGATTELLAGASAPIRVP